MWLVLAGHDNVGGDWMSWSPEDRNRTREQNTGQRGPTKGLDPNQVQLLHMMAYYAPLPAIFSENSDTCPVLSSEG